MRVGTIHARSSGLLQQNPEVPSERATQHFGNYNAFKKEKQIILEEKQLSDDDNGAREETDKLLAEMLDQEIALMQM